MAQRIEAERVGWPVAWMTERGGWPFVGRRREVAWDRIIADVTPFLDHVNRELMTRENLMRLLGHRVCGRQQFDEPPRGVFAHIGQGVQGQKTVGIGGK